MNLTSKRMLQFLSVCAGAFALTASAQTIWVSDNFEAEGAGLTNAAIGDAAGMYKANVWGTMSQWTNLTWGAGAGDASTIQAFEGSYTANSRPITEANAKAQALKLETEGQTLTRYIAFEATPDPDDDSGRTQPTTIPVSAVSGPVYVDTLMKFTPSEDDPEVTDAAVKLALFVNANSNLVLRHSYYLGGNYYPTNSIFEGNLINPEQWYRLTIKMQYHSNYGAIQAWVWLDGTPLAHYNGETEQGGAHNGPVFYTLNDSQNLSQVSFQGTGYVDDLVVPDTIVPFQTAGLTFTLAFNDDLLNVTADNVVVTPGAQVNDGATLTIYTEDWYQINSITGDGIAWTGTTLGGDLVTNATGTVTADAAGRTATINAGLFTGTIPTGLTGPYATVPADKVAAWAVANQLSLANVIANAGDYLDNYLLNISPSVDADIEITSIVYDPVAETATITVEATSTAVDFNTINGTLTVRTGDDLTALGATTEFTFSIDTPGEVVTFVVNEVAGKFIRARVE